MPYYPKGTGPDIPAGRLGRKLGGLIKKLVNPLDPNDVPVILPTIGIADTAVTVNYGSYMDLGNVGLPEGDWTLHMTAQLPQGGWTNDFMGFSMASPAANSMSQNGSLTLAYNQGSNDPFDGCYAVGGKDDAGNPISQRYPSAWMGSGVSLPVLTGPRYIRNQTDSMVRSVFIQRKNGETSIWTVEPGVMARKNNAYVGTLGAFAPKKAWLGAFTKADGTGDAARSNGGLKIQRFFKVAKALTPRQMEAVAAGVDPRQLVTFSAGAGDLLWAFGSGTAAGTTHADLIQGQVATQMGNGANGGALIPTIPVAESARVALAQGQLFQATGATTDLTLSGRYTGADGVIEVKITDHFTTSEIVKDWTQIAVGSNGEWSGTLTGIPRQIKQNRLSIRKRVGGTLVGSSVDTAKPFLIGISTILLGQSLMEFMRTGGTTTSAGTSRYALSFFSRARGNDGAVQTNNIAGWNLNDTEGYGDVKFAEAIGNTMLSPVAVMNDAVQGSPIASWIGTNSSQWIAASATILENRPKHVFWNQGHGSVGEGYTMYKASLSTLYAKLKALITWDWVFHVLPVNNNYDPIQSPGLYFDIRRAQADWVKEQRAAGETRVVLVGSVNDVTMTDGIHATNDAAGFGRFAERMAQSVLFAEGAVTYSGVGPTITGATWDNDKIVTVNLAHNGGTDIRTPNTGNITGFELSVDNFATVLTQSSALRASANQIAVTLAATPTSAPAIRYQYGKPGSGTTAAANGLSNPVYDNREPYINPTLGFPVQFTSAPIAATATGTAPTPAPAPEKVTISGTMPAGQMNVDYAFTPTVAKGSGTKTFAKAGTYPAGLVFDTASGAVSGKPTEAGTFSMGMTVTDTTGTATLAVANVVIAAAATAPAPSPTTQSLMRLDVIGGGVVESGNADDGWSYTGSGSDNNFTRSAGSSKVLPAGMDGSVQFSIRGYQSYVGSPLLAFRTGSALAFGFGDIAYGVYGQGSSNSYKVVTAGVGGITGNGPSGTWGPDSTHELRLRRSGTSIIAECQYGGNPNWFVIQTWANASQADLYVQLSFGFARAEVLKSTGFGATAVAEPVVQTWTEVAGEQQSFTLAQDSTVRFGNRAENKFTEKVLVAGTYGCDSGAFDGEDPASGFVKTCEVSNIAPTPYVHPANGPDLGQTDETDRRVAYMRFPKNIDKTSAATLFVDGTGHTTQSPLKMTFIQPNGQKISIGALVDLSAATQYGARGIRVAQEFEWDETSRVYYAYDMPAAGQPRIMFEDGTPVPSFKFEVTNTLGSGGGGGVEPEPVQAAEWDETGVTVTDQMAARMVNQASLGATKAEIASAKGGLKAWVTNQLAMPIRSMTAVRDRLDAAHQAKGWTHTGSWNTLVVEGPDWLRMKVAHALQNIIVVSTVNQDDINQQGATAAASYMDIIRSHALSDAGNFAHFLKAIARSASMGVYLTYFKNEGRIPGVHPDQNFAREVLQLFSVGLFELNPDGSNMKTGQLPANDPRYVLNGTDDVPTYTQFEIAELSRIFTGMSWGNRSWNNQGSPYYNYIANFGARFMQPDAPEANGDTYKGRWEFPMEMYGVHHDLGEKNVLGLNFPAYTGPIDLLDESYVPDLNEQARQAAQFAAVDAYANAEFERIMDVIANHPNVGRYICKQLIQYFTTSNPSPAYVARVAAKYANDGNGMVGNMKAVVRQILLDPDARNADALVNTSGNSFGRFRSYMESSFGYAKAMEARNPSAEGFHYAMGYGGGEPTQLAGQLVMRQTSVFGHWPPKYVPQGSTLNMPEMKGVTESTLAGNAQDPTGGFVNAQWSRGFKTIAEAINVDTGGYGVGQFTALLDDDPLPWWRKYGGTGLGDSKDIYGNTLTEEQMHALAAQFLDELDLILCAGQMLPETKAEILALAPVRLFTRYSFLIGSPDYIAYHLIGIVGFVLNSLDHRVIQ